MSEAAIQGPSPAVHGHHRWALPVALALALGALVAAGTPVLQLDGWVHAHAHALGSGAGVSVVRVVTAAGSLRAMALLTVLVAGLLAWQKRWRALRVWMLGMVGCGLWLTLGKLAWHRPRPSPGWVLERGYSFPSGHAMGTATAVVLLGAVLGAELGRSHRALWALQCTAVLVVMATRVYLGVHYATDVCAGALLGLGWARLCTRGYGPPPPPVAGQ